MNKLKVIAKEILKFFGIGIILTFCFRCVRNPHSSPWVLLLFIISYLIILGVFCIYKKIKWKWLLYSSFSFIICLFIWGAIDNYYHYSVKSFAPFDECIGVICPPENPIKTREISGCKCVNCNYPQIIVPSESFDYSKEEEMKYKSELKKCSNREIDESWISMLKECPKDLPLKIKGVGCFSCNATNAYGVVDKKDCDVCPNRSYKEGYCYLTKCPETEPFRTQYYNCISCDMSNCREPISKEECNKCPNLHWNEEHKMCIPPNGEYCWESQFIDDLEVMIK